MNNKIKRVDLKGKKKIQIIFFYKIPKREEKTDFEIDFFLLILEFSPLHRFSRIYYNVKNFEIGLFN